LLVFLTEDTSKQHQLVLQTLAKSSGVGDVCYRGILCEIVFPLKYDASFSYRQVYNSVVLWQY